MYKANSMATNGSRAYGYARVTAATVRRDDMNDTVLAPLSAIFFLYLLALSLSLSHSLSLFFLKFL